MKKYCSVGVTKNTCHTCIHLDYYEVGFEESGSSGYFCNGREYKNSLAEKAHLKKLQSQIYRERVKKCCERKITPHVVE